MFIELTRYDEEKELTIYPFSIIRDEIIKNEIVSDGCECHFVKEEDNSKSLYIRYSDGRDKFLTDENVYVDYVVARNNLLFIIDLDDEAKKLSCKTRLVISNVVSNNKEYKHYRFVDNDLIFFAALRLAEKFHKDDLYNGLQEFINAYNNRLSCENVWYYDQFVSSDILKREL